MEYTIVNCFGAIIEYFATFAFLWIFFDWHPDRTVWRKTGHVVGPILFLTFACCISSAYIRPMLFVIYSWVIAYSFEGDLWQRVFSVSLFQISLILLEFLIVGLVAPVADLTQPGVYLASNFLVKIITLAIIFILFLFSKKRNKFLFHTKKRHILILISFSIVSFFLVLLID